MPFQSGDAWVRIKVAALPEGGKANAAVVALLAKHLSFPKSDVRLISGETARLKRLHIQSDQPEGLLLRLQRLTQAEFEWA